MPKFSDLIKAESITSTNKPNADAIAQIAIYLRITNQKAAELFEKYGKGNVYSPSGVTLSDSRPNRYRLVKIHGYAVAVEKSGAIVYIDAEGAQKIGEMYKEQKRKREERICKREERAQKRETAQILRDRKRERLFNDGQTYGSKKRTKCHDERWDSNVYVNRSAGHGNSVMDYSPRSHRI